MNILNELRKLDKTKFNYNGEDFYIEKHEFSKGIIKIFTNKRTLVILEEDFDPHDFISKNPEALPVRVEEENKYLQNSTPFLNNSIIGQNGEELTRIIMDNIKKVKEDPSFIPQAEAINSGVKTIIDIAKTQVDAFKVLKGV
ncbi:hypothetical protein ACF3OC_07905 [Sphingobacterium cellulitidis]|uniref:hypothetical protein n=1 Tax=Sphingobacterium cellulitidis TaxID=1768011 RepID=UPI00370D9B8A